MVKATTPSFVLTLEILTNPYFMSKIEKELEISRVIYNTTLGELLKRENQMKQTKRYKKLKRMLKVVSRKLYYFEERENKDKINFYKKEKDSIMKEIFSLQAEFELTEYSMHKFTKTIREHFGNRLNSIIAQKISTRAWNTFKKKLKGEAKKVAFIKKGEMFSFEGKNNVTGYVFSESVIKRGKEILPLKIDKKDIYLQEGLSYIKDEVPFNYKDSKGQKKTSFYKVKYVSIVRKEIRGKLRYFAQMTCAGYAPPKRDKKTGEFKYQLAKGKIGIDIGTSSIAVSSETKVVLTNLGENIKLIDGVHRKISLIQRKLDRSKRQNNPENFNSNGTIKKGKKTWFFSKRYRKLKTELKELHRKLTIYRKQSHHYEVNRMLMLGDEFYVEEMNFKALQKRAKETKISKKTGKYQKKKRFGKSISNRAPSMFVNILEQKIKNQGGSFKKVDTWNFKASQFDHKSNSFRKKKLKERWHVFDDRTKAQRDLYSAFLLMCSTKSGKNANRKLCNELFASFMKLHNEEIDRLSKLKKIVLNSGVILKNKKTTSAKKVA